MLYNKQKRFINYLLAGLVFLLSLGLFTSVHTTKAQAAYNCNPTTAPCCQPPQLAGSGAAGPCFNPTTHKRYYAVADNPDKKLDPEKGFCYVTKATGYGLFYYRADCGQPPFNANFQSVSCQDGTIQSGPAKDKNGKSISADTICKGHGGAITTPSGTGGTDYVAPPLSCNNAHLTKTNCGIVAYLVIVINVLSGLVGLVVVAVIIVAGIQFTTAGNDPQKIAAAKGRIVSALLALVLFIFTYAFLQWVIPGGIF